MTKQGSKFYDIDEQMLPIECLTNDPNWCFSAYGKDIEHEILRGADFECLMTELNILEKSVDRLTSISPVWLEIPEHCFTDTLTRLCGLTDPASGELAEQNLEINSSSSFPSAEQSQNRKRCIDFAHSFEVNGYSFQAPLRKFIEDMSKPSASIEISDWLCQMSNEIDQSNIEAELVSASTDSAIKNISSAQSSRISMLASLIHRHRISMLADMYQERITQISKTRPSSTTDCEAHISGVIEEKVFEVDMLNNEISELRQVLGAYLCNIGAMEKFNEDQAGADDFLSKEPPKMVSDVLLDLKNSLEITSLNRISNLSKLCNRQQIQLDDAKLFLSSKYIKIQEQQKKLCTLQKKLRLAVLAKETSEGSQKSTNRIFPEISRESLEFFIENLEGTCRKNSKEAIDGCNKNFKKIPFRNSVESPMKVLSESMQEIHENNDRNTDEISQGSFLEIFDNTGKEISYENSRKVSSKISNQTLQMNRKSDPQEVSSKVINEFPKNVEDNSMEIPLKKESSIKDILLYDEESNRISVENDKLKLKLLHVQDDDYSELSKLRLEKLNEAYNIACAVRDELKAKHDALSKDYKGKIKLYKTLKMNKKYELENKAKMTDNRMKTEQIPNSEFGSEIPLKIQNQDKTFELIKKSKIYNFEENYITNDATVKENSNEKTSYLEENFDFEENFNFNVEDNYDTVHDFETKKKYNFSDESLSESDNNNILHQKVQFAIQEKYEHTDDSEITSNSNAQVKTSAKLNGLKEELCGQNIKSTFRKKDLSKKLEHFEPEMRDKYVLGSKNYFRKNIKSQEKNDFQQDKSRTRAPNNKKMQNLDEIFEQQCDDSILDNESLENMSDIKKKLGSNEKMPKFERDAQTLAHKALFEQERISAPAPYSYDNSLSFNIFSDLKDAKGSANQSPRYMRLQSGKGNTVNNNFLQPNEEYYNQNSNLYLSESSNFSFKNSQFDIKFGNKSRPKRWTSKARHLVQNRFYVHPSNFDCKQLSLQTCSYKKQEHVINEHFPYINIRSQKMINKHEKRINCNHVNFLMLDKFPVPNSSRVMKIEKNREDLSHIGGDRWSTLAGNQTRMIPQAPVHESYKYIFQNTSNYHGTPQSTSKRMV